MLFLVQIFYLSSLYFAKKYCMSVRDVHLTKTLKHTIVQQKKTTEVFILMKIQNDFT